MVFRPFDPALDDLVFELRGPDQDDEKRPVVTLLRGRLMPILRHDADEYFEMVPLMRRRRTSEARKCTGFPDGVNP